VIPHYCLNLLIIFNLYYHLRLNHTLVVRIAALVPLATPSSITVILVAATPVVKALEEAEGYT
jgi:hypothetical protein